MGCGFILWVRLPSELVFEEWCRNDAWVGSRASLGFLGLAYGFTVLHFFSTLLLQLPI